MPQVTEAFVSHVEGMAVVKLSEAVDNDVLKKISKIRDIKFWMFSNFKRHVIKDIVIIRNRNT